MAMTQAEFITKSGAELVGGRIVVGIQGERMVVGETDPVFVLNEDGLEILAELEAGVAVAQAVTDVTAKKVRKAKGAVADEPNAEPAPAPAPAPVQEAAVPLTDAAAPATSPVTL